MKGKTLKLTLTAMMTALMCVLGPLTIPIGPVPFTLANAVIMLAAQLLGAKLAVASCTAYLLLGAAGLPIFGNFSGGMGTLLGATGGYLIGYLLLAAISGLRCRGINYYLQQLLLHVVGTAALYILGTIWFCLYTGNGVWTALTVCVLPFLPVDAAKIFLVTFFCPVLAKRLRAAGLLDFENSYRREGRP